MGILALIFSQLLLIVFAFLIVEAILICKDFLHSFMRLGSWDSLERLGFMFIPPFTIITIAALTIRVSIMCYQVIGLLF